MGRYSAAWVAAAKAHGVFPVVYVGFPSFDRFTASSRLFGPAAFSAPGLLDPLSGGYYEGRIGSMDRIAIGVPAKPGQLGFPETRFTLLEDDRKDITRVLEATRARRSAVTIKWAAGSKGSPVEPSDYATLFTGILDRWNQQRLGEWELVAKPDSGGLEGSVPKQPILKGENPLADTQNKNPWGIYMPQVYGVHDSTALTGLGMLPTINICYDATLGYHYLISQGWIRDAPLVLVDTTQQTQGADYVFVQGVKAGKSISYISFLPEHNPSQSAIVSVDAQGYEDLGDGTGAVITNPVSQLLHWITNYGLGDHKTGTWLTIDLLLDPASWARAETWANLYGLEGAMYIGGTTQQLKAIDVINKWLETWPEFRIYWDHLGKLAIGVVTPILEDSNIPREHWIRGEDFLSFKPENDTSQIMTRLSQSYLYGVKDAKYWQTLDLQDLTQSEKIGEDLAALYSAARLV